MYQPLPDRPQSDLAVGQRYFTPAPQPGPVELYDERDPVVWVPSAYGEMVPMRKSQAPAPMQPTPPRDLSPQPLLDPQAQRLAAAGFGGGAFAAGAGWGTAQIVSALAGGATGLALLAALLLLARFTGPRGDTVTINKTVTNNNKLWGRSSTNL